VDVVNTQYRNSFSLLSRTPNFRVNSTTILPFVLGEPKLQTFFKQKSEENTWTEEKPPS